MNDHDPSSTRPPDDTIDVLDILLTLAENLRLLLLGPILVGAVAFGAAQLLPKTFESTAILKAEPSVATSMMSAPVLDAALRKLGYAEGLQADDADDAIGRLRQMASAQAGKGDALVTLKVKAPTPQAAQQLANEVLTNTFAISKPDGAELKRLVTEKTVLEQQAVELAAASKTAQKILGNAADAANLGSVPESIAALSSNLVQIQENINKVDKSILGLSRDDVLQEPTLSRRPIAPNQALIAVFAALTVALVLLAFVFVRKAWRQSNAAQIHRARLDALKRQYGRLK